MKSHEVTHWLPTPKVLPSPPPQTLIHLRAFYCHSQSQPHATPTASDCKGKRHPSASNKGNDGCEGNEALRGICRGEEQRS